MVSEPRILIAVGARVSTITRKEHSFVVVADAFLQHFAILWKEIARNVHQSAMSESMLTTIYRAS